MKLSLTAITGNCERDIVRFLDTFQPYFDEVVIVRAIGDQKADKTLEIARERGCVTGEYHNSPDNDWPHVDDFSAARNYAASLASGDWLAWADIDDLADGLKFARRILEGLPETMQIVKCPYVLPEQNVDQNFRERFWRNNGRCVWANALHENLATIGERDGPDGQTTQIKIIHAPREDRESSRERNLTILESVPEDKRTTGHQFYLTMEYMREKSTRAVDAATKFLAMPDAGQAERYEIFLGLAHMAEDMAQKAAIYTQAWADCPTRVEALYELASISLSCGQNDRALAYARQLMSLPYPENSAWNNRRKFYGRLRHDLYWQTLRANDRVQEANALEFNYLVQHQADISLIHATRKRPEMAAKCRRDWLIKAKHPERIEHLFVIDQDDLDSRPLTACRALGVGAGQGCVTAWNAGAANCMGQIIIQLSDDWVPPLHWDEAIRTRMDVSKEQVLAVSDGSRDDELLCIAIMTRKRLKAQGYMFHPEFTSMFSDNWFTFCAKRDGVIIDARKDLTFEHMHPVFGKGEMDETYRQSNSVENYGRGSHILRRLCEKTKVSSDVDGWCDYRKVYYSIASKLETGDTFVEVGSWQGQSIILLAQELQNLGKKVRLFCVDTFKGEVGQSEHLAVVAGNGGSIRSIFEANIKAAKVDDMIQIIEGDSAESAALFEDESLAGVYIDAAHDYESVKKDLAAWLPKVKPDGIFAGHDYPHHEVKQAVDEHAQANNYIVTPFGRVWIKNALQ